MLSSSPSHTLIQKMSGLNPQLWVCIGPGFVREEMKSILLNHVHCLNAQSLTTLSDLCLKISNTNSEKLLSAFSRQEVIKRLLSDRRILDRCPEIQKLKRRKNFIQRLDQTLQAARVCFAHEEEEKVYEEKLYSIYGDHFLRNELRAFAFAYETWLQANECLDLPLLIRQARDILKKEWPKNLNQPLDIFYFSTQSVESLEKDFWDSVSTYVNVHFLNNINKIENIFPYEDSNSSQHEVKKVDWEVAHSVDDLSAILSEKILTLHSTFHTIVVPDQSSILRSLKRALEAKKILYHDIRDLNRLKESEEIKKAFKILEIVSKNFERTQVTSWLKGREQSGEWIQEINQRGILYGLKSYEGGILQPLYLELVELEKTLGGKKTFSQLSENYFPHLVSFSPWVNQYIKSLIHSLNNDLELVGLTEQKAFSLYWIEKLKNRLYYDLSPGYSLKLQKGSYNVRIESSQTVPLRKNEKLWIFGLSAEKMNSLGTIGNDWYSSQELEILSHEFLIRSPLQIKDEKINILNQWVLSSNEVCFLDYLFEYDGSEKKSFSSLFKELKNINTPSSPLELGTYSKFNKSYFLSQRTPSQKVYLKPLKSSRIHAVEIDRYSRCSFQSLAADRWKLKDVREPDFDLWPEEKGKILHEAVKLILIKLIPKIIDLRKLNQNLEILKLEKFNLCNQILKQVFYKKRPLGLLRSFNVEKSVLIRLEKFLHSFFEKEIDYLERSGALPLYLDEQKFEIQYSRFSIVGKPDRVDDHPEGIFIMDYKTSGSVPQGAEMIQNGYRLQLPFYAVASKKKFEKPVLGIQFIELNRQAHRNQGIFFEQWNGKDKGKLTHLRSNSKSLMFDQMPDDVWNNLEDKIIQCGEGMLQGYYFANPNCSDAKKECARCRFSDLCGLRRRKNLIDGNNDV